MRTVSRGEIKRHLGLCVRPPRAGVSQRSETCYFSSQRSGLSPHYWLSTTYLFTYLLTLYPHTYIPTYQHITTRTIHTYRPTDVPVEVLQPLPLLHLSVEGKCCHPHPERGGDGSALEDSNCVALNCAFLTALHPFTGSPMVSVWVRVKVKGFSYLGAGAELAPGPPYEPGPPQYVKSCRNKKAYCSSTTNTMTHNTTSINTIAATSTTTAATSNTSKAVK